MLGKIIDGLFRQGQPTDTVVWECDPLVILDGEGNVTFAGKAEVEFAPDSSQGETGLAKALTTEEHLLRVEQRINRPVTVDVHVAPRGGFTLTGTNVAGEPTTWLIGRAADDYLRAPAL